MKPVSMWVTLSMSLFITLSTIAMAADKKADATQIKTSTPTMKSSEPREKLLQDTLPSIKSSNVSRNPLNTPKPQPFKTLSDGADVQLEIISSGADGGDVQLE